MLSIIPSTMSYQAPLVARSVSTVQMSAITPGDIGTTKPLGVYDPLQLMTKNPEKYRRFQEMEIKHGRMSMLACAHVFVVGAGFKFPGYISYLSFPPLKFEDIPASPIASWETLPQAGWAQIVCLIAIIDNSLVRRQPSNSVAAGGRPPRACVRRRRRRGTAAPPHPPARLPARPSARRCCPGAPATRGSPRHPVASPRSSLRTPTGRRATSWATASRGCATPTPR